MTPEQIDGLGPALGAFLERFLYSPRREGKGSLDVDRWVKGRRDPRKTRRSAKEKIEEENLEP